MHSPKNFGKNRPRPIGRAYTSADLLVQIAQHEDHDQKHYGFTYLHSHSPHESSIYPASSPQSTAVTHVNNTLNDSWPGRTRSRVIDSDSLFPPMFFPRDTTSRRGSKEYSYSSPVKISFGFRIFQIASILIVGLCLYALVDNIIFLVRSSSPSASGSVPDEFGYLEDRRSANIHEQLQSWIIHGEEEFGVLPRISSSPDGGKKIISSDVSHSPNGKGSGGGGGDDTEITIQNQNQHSSSSIINYDNLTFIINNSTLCSSVRRKTPSSSSYSPSGKLPGDGIYFMIIVHSAPDHFAERQAIRATWGSVRFLKNLGIRLVFVLGQDAGPHWIKIKNSIRRESEIFGDIVLGNFVDTYRNLTYKHLLGYKWINSFCSGATFIIKADDDVFIDVFQLFDFISRTFGFQPKPKTLVCNVFPEGTKPVRKKGMRGSKWSVTMDEYPHSVYPRYCGGLAYLATPDVIEKILGVSDRVKFFWIDDVFVTGILREIAEIEPFYLNLRYSYDAVEYRNWLLPAGTHSNGDNNNHHNHHKPNHHHPDNNYNDEEKSRLRKFPFLFAHIERGDKFSEEMNDLWRKTLRSWSPSA